MNTLMAKAFFKKTTLFATAFVLAVSTMTAAVPFILSQEVNAIGGTVCTGGCNSVQIDAVLAATVAGDVLNLDGDITLTKEMKIDKQVTIVGNGHSINAGFAQSAANGNAAINLLNAPSVTISNVTVQNVGGANLHGINAFKGSSTLNSVTISNFSKYGLVVNGSNVTVSSISTSGNAWGGVNVDQSSTSNPAKLTVGGTSSHTDVGNAAAFGVKHLFIDNATKPVSIVDTNNQYGVTSLGNARFYKLKVAPATPSNLRFAEMVCGGATNVNSISPTWNVVANAVSYNYRAITPNGSVYGPQSVGNVTSINGPFGAEGISSFAVQAVDADGLTSPWSANCSATYDATTPMAPVAQNPNGWTNGATAFSWTTPADTGSVLHYEVQYSRTHPSNVAENGPFTSNTNSLAVTLDDGPLFWQVRSVDAAGNVSAWSSLQSATIDASAPILTPNLTGGFVRGTKLVSLNVTEPYLKASAIRIVNSDYSSVAATPGISDQTGIINPLTYSWNTKLVNDGSYKVQYSARDVLSHSTSAFYDVVVDNTAPAVEMTSPVAGGVMNGKAVTVSGTATDNLSGIGSVQLHLRAVKANGKLDGYLNTVNVPVVNGVWSTTMDTTQFSDLGQGYGYGFTVIGTDLAGNSNGGGVSVKVLSIDNTAPKPVAGFPAGNLNASQVPAGFSWTQPEADAHGPLTYKVITAVSGHDSDDGVLKNGVQFVNVDGVTGTSLPYSFTNGIFYWQVEATDALGNKSLSNIHSVTIDTYVSTPTLTSPVDGATVNGASLTQKWSTDDTDVNRYVYESYNNSTVSEANLRFRGDVFAKEKTAANVDDATFYWRVQAVDNFGNKSAWSELWKLTIDNSAPTVTIIEPATNPATISGTVSEPATVKITIGDVVSSVTSTDGNWSIDTPPMAQGRHEVSVVATDLAGNTTSPAVTTAFFVDTITPTVAVDTPDATLVRDSTPTLTGTYDNKDDNTDLVLTLFIDDDEDGINIDEFVGGVWTYTPTAALTQGEHSFVIKASDTSGNSSISDELKLVIDTIAPVLTVLTVSGAEGNTPTITGTAEAGSRLLVTFNGQTVAVNNVDGAWAFTSPVALANGTYAFTITATDDAGNVRTGTTDVVVAVTAPATTQSFTVTPPIISPIAAADILGETTDNTANDTDDAAVAGDSTKNTLAVAAGSEANKGTFLGLNWYWWLLILAAVAATAWWIFGAIRNRQTEN